MAPRPPASSKSSSKSSSKGKKPSSSSYTSSSKPKSSITKRPPPKQVKTRPGSQTATKLPKRKPRVYTDKELNLPMLNGIVPAGVQKPKGKKKGKIFVDDRESMMTILAMVTAEKEGQIESKLIKERRMEEIREARRREAEVRHERKKGELEGVKRGLKRGKSHRKKEDGTLDSGEGDGEDKKLKSRKRVAFA